MKHVAIMIAAIIIAVAAVLIAGDVGATRDVNATAMHYCRTHAH